MKKIITLALVFGALTIYTFTSCESDDVAAVGRAETVKPVADFLVTAEKFRAEEKIVFTDKSSDIDGFITSWNWDFGDGENSQKQSPEHFYADGGEYVITLTVVDNTGSSSILTSKTITLEQSLSSTPPTELWNYTLEGKLNHSSPSLSDDGTLFIGFNQAIRENQGPDFIAIKNGAKVWDQVFFEGSENKSDQIRSSPSISADGFIYTASFYSRKIWRLNASTGAIEGEYNTDARIRYSCPVFGADGTVYVGGYNKAGKGFYSLDASLNTMNWVFEAGEDFNSTPAIASDGTIYVSSTNDNVYAINPDGTEKWRAVYGTWAATAIAIGEDGTVYFAGENGSEGVLIAYNPADGTEKWRKTLPAKANQGGPAIAPDGTIYLGGYEEKMIAYNPDGTEKWSYTANGAIETVPAIDNEGNLYFGDLAGFFHVISPDGEKLYKVVKLGDEIHSSAVIGSDGTIYVAANDGDFGKVYAFQTEATGLANGGWPMYAKDAKHTGR
ncbi:PQQ-binding-like beta-propeller repeat protein [uncultured Algibacter sp.]|uniref:outer membrane protein assembly factor BamB family protein n=1 Tax=uncultured Algibacter sp. TaxID=298659 RepID=UPI0026101488|nr:PQQ-binding-like beta-propeller repeat protein [uncultured Algibacter sp.]